MVNKSVCDWTRCLPDVMRTTFPIKDEWNSMKTRKWVKPHFCLLSVVHFYENRQQIYTSTHCFEGPTTMTQIQWKNQNYRQLVRGMIHASRNHIADPPNRSSKLIYSHFDEKPNPCRPFRLEFGCPFITLAAIDGTRRSNCVFFCRHNLCVGALCNRTKGKTDNKNNDLHRCRWRFVVDFNEGDFFLLSRNSKSFMIGSFSFER